MAVGYHHFRNPPYNLNWTSSTSFRQNFGSQLAILLFHMCDTCRLTEKRTQRGQVGTYPRLPNIKLVWRYDGMPPKINLPKSRPNLSFGVTGRLGIGRHKVG